MRSCGLSENINDSRFARWRSASVSGGGYNPAWVADALVFRTSVYALTA
jgi:hypothetical protein